MRTIRHCMRLMVLECIPNSTRHGILQLKSHLDDKKCDGNGFSKALNPFLKSTWPKPLQGYAEGETQKFQNSLLGYQNVCFLVPDFIFEIILPVNPKGIWGRRGENQNFDVMYQDVLILCYVCCVLLRILKRKYPAREITWKLKRV